MSENNIFPNEDAFTFMHALALVRKCFLPIMVVVLLSVLPAVFGMLIEWQGRDAASVAKEAALAEFFLEAEDLHTQWAAENLANNTYDKTLQPYSIAAACVKLISWLYTPWMTIGLYKGLLSALRGGECRLNCLFSALHRWKTALWLSILTGLCTFAAFIAGTVLMAGLSAVLNIVGVIIGLIAFVIGIYWVSLHLLTAEVHLADDAAGDCTATDCIRYSWQEMKDYGLFSALCVLWPVYLLTEVFSLLVDNIAPLPALDVANLLVQLVCTALIYAASAGIYEEIRRREASGIDRGATSDGLARARALASGESAE